MIKLALLFLIKYTTVAVATCPAAYGLRPVLLRSIAFQILSSCVAR